MTTVAWRGNLMAADSLANCNGVRITAVKIHRVGDCVIGFAGCLEDGIAFVKWFGGDRQTPLDFRVFRHDGSDAPDVVAIVAGPDGVERWTEHLQPYPIYDEFFAIGSGAKAALAAMRCGRSAPDAVEIASQVDAGTNGHIQVVKIAEPVVCSA